MELAIEIDINKLHDSISEIVEAGEVIGYLKMTDHATTPCSVIAPDGSNLGDYCCRDHAVDSAWKKHHKIIELETSGDSPRSLARKLLLAAMLSALAKQ